MTQAPPVREFNCPRCSAALSPTSDDPRVSCPSCQWTGRVFFFSPVALRVDQVEAALPEDAACAQHPNRRAVATCAGSGDFICALCSVEMEGKTFSAKYLESGGKTKIKDAFERHMKRPDREAIQMAAISFVPCLFFLSPLWVALGIFKLVKAHKMRRENPLFARAVSKTSLILAAVVIGLQIALWITFAVFMGFAAFKSSVHQF